MYVFTFSAFYIRAKELWRLLVSFYSFFFYFSYIYIYNIIFNLSIYHNVLIFIVRFYELF